MSTYASARPDRPRAEAGSLDIAAFILALLFPIAGMIMGYVSRGQAKRAGLQPCALSTWAVVLGWIFTILAIVLIIVLSVSLGAAVVHVGNDYCLNHPFAARCQ